MNKQFIRFLKDNNAYYAFLTQFKSQKNENVLNFILDKSNNEKTTYIGGAFNEKTTYIGGAFTWNESNEGFHFWSNINSKWTEIMRNYE